MDAEKLYKWIIEVLEKNGYVDEGDLYDKIPNEDIEHVLFFLNYLVSKGFVKAEIVGSNTKYVLQNIEEIRRLLGYITEVSAPSPDNKLEESIVISIPLSLTEHFEALKKRYDSPIINLKDAVKLLLLQAKKEVLIASPFIEMDGVMYIIDELVAAAKNGASLKMITRDILNTKSDNYSYVNKLKAISKLRTLFESNKSKPDAIVSIRDFGSQISGLGRTTAHYEGIHQKMVIVDRKYAYVGSGEIRAASFVTNGEAGYLFVGEKAAFWADYFDLFWKSAKEVPTDYLR